MKELIEQIGGRDALINFMQNGVRPSWIEVEMMSRALLAVLDAQENPSAWIINCNSARINFAETEKTSVDKIIEECRENGTDIDITPLYTAPPVASAPEWSNAQCMEFLTVAFRHCDISGDIEMDDIRLGVKMANAAAPTPGDK